MQRYSPLLAALQRGSGSLSHSQFSAPYLYISREIRQNRWSDISHVDVKKATE
jgi:hypothetical protein